MYSIGCFHAFLIVFTKFQMSTKHIHPDCRGITYEPDNSKLYKFSLREGSKPAASAINEISWVKTICENGESTRISVLISVNEIIEIFL